MYCIFFSISISALIVMITNNRAVEMPARGDSTVSWPTMLSAVFVYDSEAALQTARRRLPQLMTRSVCV